MPDLILEPAERARRLSELELVSTTATELTDSMLKLAHQLSLIHGRVRVANEKGGAGDGNELASPNIRERRLWKFPPRLST